MLKKDCKIFVAGHNGMVGSAIVRSLQLEGYQNIITCSRDEVDLTEQQSVREFIGRTNPEQVILAAAKVGGIYANNHFPAEFIYENLMIQNNIIHSSYQAGVSKLLFLGSSCIYPKLAAQPITEGELLSDKLEPTNEPYAVAKIAGIKMCESYNRQYGTDYRSVMPTNLYGINDNFHPENSHVIPALLRRFHEAAESCAKSVTVWGTGNARREFLNVNDMAKACCHIMKLEQSRYQSLTEPMLSHINVGTGIDVSINELATLLAEATKFRGKIIFDTTKPDGTPQKLLSNAKLRSTNWAPTISLAEGLKETYEWYKKNQGRFRV